MPTDGPSSFGMRQPARCCGTGNPLRRRPAQPAPCRSDRKSTRLNSSHMSISYAVFCLKQKIDLAQFAGRGHRHFVEDADEFRHLETAEMLAAMLGQARFVVFFFHHTPATEIDTLALHDTLPI